MRLLSITARNYRIHRDLTVEFDPSRNLIGGPNETGKSTLAEAMHRALFLRARTGGSVQKSMVSDIHHGKPEVVLVFEVGGQVWTIEKRFAGTTSATGTAYAVNIVFGMDRHIKIENMADIGDVEAACGNVRSNQ